MPSREGFRSFFPAISPIDTWQQPWHGWIDRWTLPLCDVVGRQLCRRAGGLRKASCPLIEETALCPRRQRRGCRSVHGSGQSQSPRSAASSDGLHRRRRTLSMRLHAEKGAEKIPAFAAGLLKANPKLILVIGGTGPMEARLKEETHSFGERVRWIGWQDDAVRFLSAARLLLSALARRKLPAGAPGSIRHGLALDCARRGRRPRTPRGRAPRGRDGPRHVPRSTHRGRSKLPAQ